MGEAKPLEVSMHFAKDVLRLQFISIIVTGRPLTILAFVVLDGLSIRLLLTRSHT